jgi:NAD+ synthase
MKKIKNYNLIAGSITDWLKSYAEESKTKGFVIGVSGGIDSAVVSTLCAKTELKLLVIEMPIHQGNAEVTRAKEHIQWLKNNFHNVESIEINLSNTYDALYENYSNTLTSTQISQKEFDFSMANTRSRLRMTTLYQFAGTHKLLVAGTGNKVEDFGVGFYTKYGDGGVDISPIADLMKSEVYELGRELGITESILTAAPTDGLHADGRTDEEQLKCTYSELEWAMKWIEDSTVIEQGVGTYYDDIDDLSLLEREREVLEIYNKFHNSNKHKMTNIPVFNSSDFRA